MTPDPYAPYLRQADELFAQGEIVKAGQIWQAILKQQPSHQEARDRLLALRDRLLAQREAEAAAAVPAAPAPAPPPIPAPAPEPVPEPPPPPASSNVGPDRMVIEGCTLYDLGQVADALQKWEQALALDPGHTLALGYANGARRELGLPPLQDSAPTGVPEAAPAAAEEEDVAKLLREAVQLYDMGLTEEAISKWERVLVLEPHREEVRVYLRQAKQEVTQAQVVSTPVPAPPAAAAQAPAPSTDAEALALKLRQAEHLLSLQRYEEAAFTFQQALSLAPGHPAVLEGLERCRRPRAASPSPTVEPAFDPRARIAMVEEEPTLVMTHPGPVEPPLSLTKSAPAAREGLTLPDRLQEASSRLPWLREPRVWAWAGGVSLALGVGLYALHTYRKDQELKEAVKAARAAAVAPVLQQAQAPDLAETPAAMLQEAESALEVEPLHAYLRVQAVLAMNPGDAAAAQLLEKARLGLPGGVTGASLPEFQKHLQNGDLEAAAKVMDALLRAQPDDPSLRARAARLHLALCSAHVSQAKWAEAAGDLRRGRALFPADKTWQTRLRLLERVKTLPKAEQAAWLPLLG